MSEVRPARPTLATIISIWLIVVFCFGLFGLMSSLLVSAARPDMPHLPAAQVALTVLSLLLALGGAITLLQMNPMSWQLLIGRVVVDAIALVMTIMHPLPLPANVASDPNASSVVGMMKTGGLVIGGVMLLVNLGIALYARSATTAVSVGESTPASA